MHVDEKTYHLINQYLAGELAGTALDAFKAKLKDPEFKEQVDIQQQIVQAIEQVREDELKALLKQDTKVRYIQNQWGNRWTYASAAIFIIFVSAFFIMRQFVDTEQRPVVKEEPITKENNESIVEQNETLIDSNTLAINEAPSAPVPLPPEIQVVEDEVEVEELVTEDFDEEADAEAIAEVMTIQKTLEHGEISKIPVEIPVDRDVVATRSSSGVPDVKDENVNIKSKKLESTKTYTVLMLSPSFVETDEADSEEDTTAYSTRQISVEFWSSPINFKGYNYSKNTLKLYTVAESASISFKELDNRLYIRIGSQHYFIKKNGSDNKFVAVSNETLLKVLNE